MRFCLLLIPLLALAACAGSPAHSAIGPAAATSVAPGQPSARSTRSTPQPPEAPLPFEATPVAEFDGPWAIAFLPGTSSALITEQRGALKLWTEGGDAIRQVAGVPAVDFGGQGGLGDVVVAPDFINSRRIYLSWVEAGASGTRGAVVGQARLADDAQGLRLEGLQIVWRQVPKVTGRGHFSHRVAFSPDGKYLWITSGDRQKKDPAQDLSNNLGATLRLLPDGSVPADNPFVERGGVAAQIWSYGHRNLLGIAFDANTGNCGPARWARAAATKSTAKCAAPITAGRWSPMGTTTTARTFPITRPDPSFKHPPLGGTR